MAERKTTKTKHNENETRFDRVLWSTILFAMGVLTAAFTFVKGESLWTDIHNILLGLFGVSVFLVPVILIYVSVMIALDKTEVFVSVRVIQSFVLIMLVSAFVQIIFSGELVGDKFFAETLPIMYAQGQNLKGGGLISIIIAGPLLALFKQVGSAIIIILVIFVFIMIMSNITIIDIVKWLGNSYRKSKESHDEYRAESAKIREEKLIARKLKAEEEAKNAVNKKTPNGDVPKKAAEKNQKDFNVDIPFNKKDTNAQIKETGTATPLPVDDVQAENIVMNSEVAKNNIEMSSAKNPVEKAPESPKLSELDAIIKKAAAEKNIIAKAVAEKKISKSKQSTLASDKINTEDELDMPEALTAADIQNEISSSKKEAIIYNFPPIGLLKQADNARNAEDAEVEMKANADTLVDTLKSFGVQTRIVDIHRGPTVTRYELQPSAGVKISKITSLSDDIALNLAAAGVRIEAPIPGKAAVGIEVPNRVKDLVSIREMIESEDFENASSKLSFVVGKNIDGEVIVGDIGKMPHVIIAGTTGSGKSVCTNSIIMSILYNATPDEVRLVLIDPKMVEFKTYDGIPHLLIPVVTDPRKAAGALSWAVQEMLKRYKLFADNNVRDLAGYNEFAEKNDGVEPLPRIVIAIDELADLMMACANEVEDSICRLAQMARAAGMHLIIATQRPTVDVITGLIKANIPSRIALTVSSQVDSRTIIDTAGAEKLLGYGDMLYYPSGIPKPIRIQGCFVSTKEVESVVEFIKSGGTVEYSEEIIEEIEKSMPAMKSDKNSDGGDVSTGDGSDDAIIEAAVEVLSNNGQASVSFLQRKLKLGYARAARVMDQLEELGVVGPYEGSKPRKVLITQEMWLQRKLINEDNIEDTDTE